MSSSSEARVNFLHEQAAAISAKHAEAVELAGRFSGIKLPKASGPREPGEVVLPSSGATAQDALVYSDVRMRALMDDPGKTMAEKRAYMRNYTKIANLGEEIKEDAARWNENFRHAERAEKTDQNRARQAAADAENRKAQAEREQDARWLTRTEFDQKYGEA
jgi:hypothetical protein